MRLTLLAVVVAVVAACSHDQTPTTKAPVLTEPNAQLASKP
jgi:hypothetical protein